jgi:hypothetical protein
VNAVETVVTYFNPQNTMQIEFQTTAQKNCVYIYSNLLKKKKGLQKRWMHRGWHHVPYCAPMPVLEKLKTVYSRQSGKVLQQGSLSGKHVSAGWR